MSLQHSHLPYSGMSCVYNKSVAGQQSMQGYFREAHDALTDEFALSLAQREVGLKELVSNATNAVVQSVNTHTTTLHQNTNEMLTKHHTTAMDSLTKLHAKSDSQHALIIFTNSMASKL